MGKRHRDGLNAGITLTWKFPFKRKKALQTISDQNNHTERDLVEGGRSMGLSPKKDLF